MTYHSRTCFAMSKSGAEASTPFCDTASSNITLSRSSGRCVISSGTRDLRGSDIREFAGDADIGESTQDKAVSWSRSDAALCGLMGNVTSSHMSGGVFRWLSIPQHYQVGQVCLLFILMCAFSTHWCLFFSSYQNIHIHTVSNMGLGTFVHSSECLFGFLST